MLREDKLGKDSKVRPLNTNNNDPKLILIPVIIRGEYFFDLLRNLPYIVDAEFDKRAKNPTMIPIKPTLRSILSSKYNKIPNIVINMSKNSIFEINSFKNMLEKIITIIIVKFNIKEKEIAGR